MSTDQPISSRPVQPDPQIRLADKATRIREIASVDESIAQARRRIRDHLTVLNSAAAQDRDTERIKRALNTLVDTRTSKSFHEKWNSSLLFKKKGADWLIAFEWKQRYGVHLLGALRTLLEIREDFIGADTDDNLDYQCVEQLNSATNMWVTCWCLVRGSVAKERRTGMGQGFSLNTTMCTLEASIGRIIQSKGVIERKHKADIESGIIAKDAALPNREETSHRCHQVLCCKPHHLVAELQSENYQRMYCQALDTCAQQPHYCLLPHRNTRVRQYQFIENLIRRRRGLQDNQPTPRTVHRRREPGRKPGRPRKHPREEEQEDKENRTPKKNQRSGQQKSYTEISDDDFV